MTPDEAGDGAATNNPPTPPTESPPAAMVQLSHVTARRCDGRVASVLGKGATFTDPWFFTADDDITGWRSHPDVNSQGMATG